MIKTTDLRIGNVIFHKEREPFRIDTKAELMAIEDVPEDFDGILINEYRLREMGFTKLTEPDQLDQYEYGLDFLPTLRVVVNPSWTKRRFIVRMSNVDRDKIIYVHELQNLVLDFTGRLPQVGLDPMP